MHARTELEQMLDVFNQKKYKTIDSHILEYTGGTTDPRIARVVKHLGRAIINNPKLLHAMVMEDLMEAEAERERIEKEQIKQKLEASENAKIEVENAKIEAENAKNKTDLENDLLKVEVEALRQQLQKQNNTLSL